MLVNASNLALLGTGFSTAYSAGVGQASSDYLRICTTVSAAVREQTYAWLGKIPAVREWIGPRALQNLSVSDYKIREKAWELTITVDKDDIETDNLGIYGPMFTQMGLSTGAKWDELVWGLLKAGFSTNCYDGQYFFDTDHPVLDANGVPTAVSNTGGGAGSPWFLMDVSQALRPIILQKRRDFEFVAKTRVDDDHVFMNKEFIYGSDARANVGFGFWQFAYGSKQTLDATSYEAARVALTGQKGDFGRPLGLRPNLLVVAPANEGIARKLLNSELTTGGETNPWKGTAELLVTPWLA